MLRLLIEDMTLVKNEKIQIHIRWKAGATASIERPLPLSAPDLVRTPAEIVELIRALATEKTDAQIAQTLNARCFRTGRKNSFARLIVRHVRLTYGIPSYADGGAPKTGPFVGVNGATSVVALWKSEALFRAANAGGGWIRTCFDCLKKVGRF